MMGEIKISTDVISLFLTSKKSYSKLIGRVYFTEAFSSLFIPSATVGHPQTCYCLLMKFIFILIFFPLPPFFFLFLLSQNCRMLCSCCLLVGGIIRHVCSG